MKYLLLLALIALAGVEYLHHVADNHMSGAPVCTDPQARKQEARELLRQHLYSHH